MALDVGGLIASASADNRADRNLAVQAGANLVQGFTEGREKRANDEAETQLLEEKFRAFRQDAPPEEVETFLKGNLASKRAILGGIETKNALEAEDLKQRAMEARVLNSENILAEQDRIQNIGAGLRENIDLQNQRQEGVGGGVLSHAVQDAFDVQAQDPASQQLAIESGGLTDTQLAKRGAELRTPLSQEVMQKSAKAAVDLEKSMVDRDAAKFKLQQAQTPAAKAAAGAELRIKVANANKAEESIKKAARKEAHDKKRKNKEIVTLAGKSDNINDVIDDVLKLASDTDWFNTTGLTGAVFGEVAGTDSHSLRGLVDILSADAAFTELMRIKASGATLGSVAVEELKLLKSAQSKMDPNLKKEVFIAQVETYRALRIKTLKTVTEDLASQGLDVPKTLTDVIGKLETSRDKRIDSANINNFTRVAPLDMSNMSDDEASAAHNALPANSWFINPSNGVTMKKK